VADVEILYAYVNDREAFTTNWHYHPLCSFSTSYRYYRSSY